MHGLRGNMVHGVKWIPEQHGSLRIVSHEVAGNRGKACPRGKMDHGVMYFTGQYGSLCILLYVVTGNMEK